jgi:hypothetical protein
MIKLKPNSPDNLNINSNLWEPDTSSAAQISAGQHAVKVVTRELVAPAAVAPHPELIAEPQPFDQDAVELLDHHKSA